MSTASSKHKRTWIIKEINITLRHSGMTLWCVICLIVFSGAAGRTAAGNNIWFITGSNCPFCMGAGSVIEMECDEFDLLGPRFGSTVENMSVLIRNKVAACKNFPILANVIKNMEASQCKFTPSSAMEEFCELLSALCEDAKCTIEERAYALRHSMYSSPAFWVNVFSGSNKTLIIVLGQCEQGPFTQ